jgi:hypothetical protein
MEPEIPEPFPLIRRPDPPENGYVHVHRILMTVGRQRFEITVRVGSREITRGPAEVIEMPAQSQEE